MAITCVRRLQYAIGHRVKNHESKCAHLHGHNYVFEIEARAVHGLDSVGRVIDFSVLKSAVGGWIERYWDHGFVLWEQDTEGFAAMSAFSVEMRKTLPTWDQKLFSMPTNPTAENMAEYLLRTVCPNVLRGTGVEVCCVRVRETENCWAEASL